jgi:hypothetical protein
MANTPNLGLYKPDRNDSVDVDVSLAQNFETIDTETKGVKDRLVAVETNITSLGTSQTEASQKAQTALDTADGVNTRLTVVEVDVEELKTTGVPSSIAKKVNGFINIAEYNAIGDGVTDDQTAIVNAVADAMLRGYALNWGWDGKTFLTSASIPDFHKVKHIGNAIIKRGTDLFYLAPTSTQRNKIYVSSSGASNTFDGLSASQPVARLQVAFDWLANYGPVLPGFWEVVLTAGTFPNRAALKAGLQSENPIEVKGVDVGSHPNVPTTIISEGVGAGAVGIFVSNGSKIKVSNVKFTGFNGTTSSAGIKAANGSELETSNCHFDSCYWGVSGEGRSRIVVPDGIFNNCGYLNGGGGTGACIRSLQLNNHVIGIQNAGVQTNTAVFKNSYQAALLQESSTGHVDWCNVEDCTYGIVVRVNARANVDGTSFKRNGVDLRAEANGHVFVSSNVVFAPAGADESPNKIMTGSGGNITSADVISGVELQYATTDKTFARSALAQTINTTTATTFYTAILKTPLWRNTPTVTSPMKKLFVRIIGTLNGTAGTKTVNLKLGGITAGVTFNAAETGAFVAEGYIFFTGQTAQTLLLMANRNGGADTKIGKTSSTLVMTSNTNITADALVANVADSVVIDIIEVGWA